MLNKNSDNPSLYTCILDLSVLPFGALRKAQSVLDREDALTDHSEDENSEGESIGENSENESSNRNVVIKPRKDIAKRSNKHA